MKALVERFNKIELRVDDIEVGEESLIFWGWITTHFKVEEERVEGMEVETFKVIEESLFL